MNQKMSWAAGCLMCVLLVASCGQSKLEKAEPWRIKGKEGAQAVVATWAKAVLSGETNRACSLMTQDAVLKAAEEGGGGNCLQVFDGISSTLSEADRAVLETAANGADIASDSPPTSTTNLQPIEGLGWLHDDSGNMHLVVEEEQWQIHIPQ